MRLFQGGVLLFKTDAMYVAVVVYCHSEVSVKARLLFRAQDHNMTNGDFAFFTFWPSRGPHTDRPWTVYDRFVDDSNDLPRRRRAFYAVKQVTAFVRHSYKDARRTICLKMFAYKRRKVECVSGALMNE